MNNNTNIHGWLVASDIVFTNTNNHSVGYSAEDSMVQYIFTTTQYDNICKLKFLQGYQNKQVHSNYLILFLGLVIAFIGDF